MFFSIHKCVIWNLAPIPIRPSEKPGPVKGCHLPTGNVHNPPIEHRRETGPGVRGQSNLLTLYCPEIHHCAKAPQINCVKTSWIQGVRRADVFY